MSGPIVRSGPSPEFSRNWESIFGKKPAKKAGQPAAAKSAKKKPAGAAKKPALKKAAAKKKKVGK